MDLWQACILGVVQGLTEFLPVSSSAHLILTPWLFDWNDPGLSYDVFLHLGTLVAVLTYFVKDWIRLGSAGFRSIIERSLGYDPDRRMFWLIVLGTIPAGLAGLFLHSFAESTFRAPLLIAVTLAVVGFALYWVDGVHPAVKNLDQLTLKEALWIGVFQAFAIVPGVSRSGATMIAARFFSFRRDTSARYSFLLSFPIILAAALYELPKLLQSSTEVSAQIPISLLIGGFLSSAISGLFAIHFLLKYLTYANFKVFAWYRLLVAALIIGYSIFVK